MSQDLTVGIIALAFGVFTLIARIVRPEMFWKLGPMQKFYGNRAGYWVHVVGYTVMPLLIGGWLIYKSTTRTP